MKDPRDFVNEEVSKEHRAKVLAAASSLLQENFRSASEHSGRRLLFKALFGGAIAAAAAFGIFTLKSKPGVIPDEEFVAMASDPAIDIESLADLDIIEDLEDLEKWEQG